MKTTKQKIDYIFSSEYIPNCHPSREFDHKIEEAIKTLAEQIDTIWIIVKAYKTGKL